MGLYSDVINAIYLKINRKFERSTLSIRELKQP